ncbi:NAD(P)/FAD-dependent oxidoreductase [Pseudomonas benzenivorans]|uniref:FAD-dependent oxidoreductase n=1 Tax=Pseudomonas benzenivorans TaxID=556533 RepID=A0ABY5HB84_9PSED|nr:FAD-binding oxidoreductase [Pseudomonas benzenivorans]UTW09086.1 FAD-dependent oxidoreductase [Pseudomonas benzenivorans]
MPAQPPISLWMDQIDTPAPPRAALGGSLEVDVAIVGAGYTGLWTAYYLKRQAPELRIAMLEAEYAGFGASGRNGGWLLGGLLGEERLLAALPDEARRAAFALLHGIPDEVAAVLQREGITCDYRKGGVLHCAARYPEQAERLRTWLEQLHGQGLGEADYRWLTPGELGRQLRIHGALGAVHSPHCATVQPARLVQGLALAVERLGVQLFEQSRVCHWQPGLLRTTQGELRAEWVVPAVEAYAGELPPLTGAPGRCTRLQRFQLPVQSLMVATEPLPLELWQTIGLEQGQAFGEFSRQVTYGQRSADDRLVFGARGGYRFGGRLRRNFALTDEEIGLRRQLLGELFPQLRNVALSHAWGGNLGMARRFQPHMLLDRHGRIALAGGYGGEGVGASNLAGRTLADLLLGRASPLTAQPWVFADSPLTGLKAWEAEPWRWLGYNAIVHSFGHEDRVLADPHSPPWRRALAARLADFMEGLMG